VIWRQSCATMTACDATPRNEHTSAKGEAATCRRGGSRGGEPARSRRCGMPRHAIRSDRSHHPAMLNPAH